MWDSESILILGHLPCVAGRALAHNDRSIQENHHIMTVFMNLAADSSINFAQVPQSLFRYYYTIMPPQIVKHILFYFVSILFHG